MYIVYRIFQAYKVPFNVFSFEKVGAVLLEDYGMYKNRCTHRFGVRKRLGPYTHEKEMII